MTTPKPKWRETNIEELAERVARGEWPLIRAIKDDGYIDMDSGGRLMTIGGAPAMILLDVGDTRLIHIADRKLELWTSEDEPYSAQIDRLAKCIEQNYPFEPDRTGESEGAVDVAIRLLSERGRPGHRAYTITDQTLALARAAASICDRQSTRGSRTQQAGAAALKALENAQGVPEADLRQLARWVMDRADTNTDAHRIADGVLTNLLVDAMPEGSVQVRSESEAIRWHRDQDVITASVEHGTLRIELESAVSARCTMRWHDDTPVEFTVHKPYDRALSEEAMDVTAAVYWSRRRGAARGQAKIGIDYTAKPDRTAVTVVHIDGQRMSSSLGWQCDAEAELERGAKDAGPEPIESQRLGSTRPSLPAGWSWADHKIAEAWGPGGAFCSIVCDELKVAGDVPRHVVDACELASGSTPLRRLARALHDRREAIANDRLHPIDQAIGLLEWHLRESTAAKGPLVEALKRQPAGIIINTRATPEAQAARLLDDYMSGMATLRKHQAANLERIEELEPALGLARARARTLTISLMQIEAMLDGEAASTVKDPGMDMPAEVADALVSKVMQRLIEHDRQAQRAAHHEALVGATESLVRRFAEHMREVDPEWVESLRKAGS